MSQDDVLSVFEPDEILTWPEIIDRCLAMGNARKTVEKNITAAYRTGKLKAVGVAHTGRRGRSLLKYAVVV